MTGIGVALMRRWRMVLAGTIACFACLVAGLVSVSAAAPGRSDVAAHSVAHAAAHRPEKVARLKKLGRAADAGAAAIAIMPTQVPSCPVDADQWTAASGAWETAGNWSKGVPTSSEYVCITAANAAVTVNSTDTVTGLLLGTGASVDIQTGGLTLAGGTGVSPSALQGALTVAHRASLGVASGAQLLNATGGSITNQGTALVHGNFEQDAGTVASGTGDGPVQLANGSSLTFAGTGTGAFQVADPTTDAITISLSGNLASGQSLDMPAQDVGAGALVTTVNATGSFTNAGTITIDHTGQSANSSALLSIPAGDTLTNTGTISVSGDPGGSTASTDNETISGAVANQGTLNVGISGNPAPYLILAAGSTLVNTGTIDVAAASAPSNSTAAVLRVAAATGQTPAATLQNDGGTITDQGAVLVSGSFSQGAASVATGSGDNPVLLGNGSSLAFTGAGPGAFRVSDPTTDAITVSLSGNLASGQSLDMPAQDVGAGALVTTVNATGSFTNAGTITIDHTGQSANSSALLSIPAGDTLTNTGTISVSGDPGGSIASADNERISGAVDNQGTLNVGISGNPAAYLILPSGSNLTNQGVINVRAGNTLAIPSAATNAAGGSIANQGTISVSGSFTQGAGTVATGSGDNPVLVANGSSLAFNGTGASAFRVADSSTDAINVSLSGNLAPGQSLDMPAQDIGVGSSTTTVNAAGSFTNGGTITIDHSGQDANSSALLALPSGDALTNTGTISVSGDAGGSTANSDNVKISGALDNHGTLNVGISGNPAAYLIFPSGSNLTNEGTINVLAGDTFSIAANVSNNAGGSVVNTGTMSVAGTFTQGAGTVATGSGNNPVLLANHSSIAFTGTGPGAFRVADSSTDAITVSLSGDLAPGQSLDMPAQDVGVGSSTTTVNAAGSFTNAGTITIDHAGQDANSSAVLALPSGDTLTNTGTISVSGDAGGSSASNDNETIKANIDNQGTFNVGISGNPAAYLILPGGETLTDEGAINVLAGSTLAAAASVSGKSGTIAPAGTFVSTGGFTEEGARTSGGSVQVFAGKLVFQGSGQASFLVPPGGDPSLAGNIAAGQSLTIDDDNGVCGGTVVSASSAFTNAGTIAFESNVCPSAPAVLAVGGTLTNTGTISFAQTQSGAGEIDGPVSNLFSGTVTVDDNGSGKIGGALTNNGAVDVAWGTLTLAGGLANLDNSTHTLTGGTYRVTGSSGDPATLDVSAPLGSDVETLDAAFEVGDNASINGINMLIRAVGVSGALTLDEGEALPVASQENFTNDGRLSVGAGVVVKPNAYTQSSSASLTIGVDGRPNSNQFGQITATGGIGGPGAGQVSLAGSLAIADVSTFTPTSGDVYTPVSGHSLTGTFSDITGTDVGGTLAYTAQYSSTAMQLAVGPGVDLGASAVTGPSSATVGQPINVGWTVTDSGGAATGGWTDSVYLSPSAAVSSGAVLLGTVTHNGGLGAGQSYHGSLTTNVPGVVPGTWRLVVVADAGGQAANVSLSNRVAASAPLTVSMTQIAVPGTATGTIPANGDSYVEVNPPAGSNVTVTATFPGPATGQLFEAYGRVPSPGDYDAKPTDTSAPAQIVTIAGAQSGTYFVDLNNPTGSPQSFTLTSAAPSTTITSVTPATATFVADCYFPVFAAAVRRAHVSAPFEGCPPDTFGFAAPNQLELTATIEGAGFSPASTAALECGGLPPFGPSSGTFAATSVTYVSSTELYADFGPVPSPTGTCTVTVTTGANTAQLTNAITFTLIGLLSGNQNQLPQPPPETPSVSIDAPSINRPNVDSFVTIDYSNPYPYPIPAPLMEIDATGATLHYPDLPAGDGSSLPLLGTAPTGDPGVLQSGESGSLEVAFDSTVGAHQNVSFEVNTLNNPGDQFYLGDLLANLLGPGADAGVVGYVQSAGGTPTGAAVQSTLDADATYLSSIGRSATDTGQLFAYELSKLVNYGAVLANHTGGPLGAGLPGLVDTATADGHGNVTVADPTGASATFAALPGGGFAAPAGVRSSLSAATGGGWVMSQPDGSTDTFNSGGQLTVSTDSYGNSTQYTYNGQELTSISAPNGDVITLGYDSSGHVTSLGDALTGQTRTYGYDATGRLTSITGGGAGNQLSWNHSSNEAVDGTLASVTNSAGVTTSFAYNGAGQPTQITRNGSTTLASYSYPSSGTVAITNGDGNKTSAQLDATGQIARTVLPDGTIVSDAVNSDGQPTSISVGGSTEELAYDGDGNVTSITNAAGGQTSFGYTPADLLAAFTDPTGLQTQIASNAQGSPTTVTDPAGNATQLAYDPLGELASVTRRDGNTVHYSYDASGEVVSASLPGGGIESLAYDGHHNLTSATNSAGTTSYSYDSDGRMTSVTYPTGVGLTYTYDSAGRRASVTTSDGYQVNYHYDAAGRLASLTDGSGNTIVSYAYNAADQPTTISDGNGTSTQYAYDSRGNIASVVNDGPTGSATSSFAYTRNALGETTSITTPGATTGYSYDAGGELTRAALAGGRTLNYSYDAAANRTATGDSAGNPATYTLGPDDEYASAGGTSYTYDSNGNLKSSTDSHGTTTYTWNGFGQLAAASGPAGDVSYAYDAGGNLISEDINGTTSSVVVDPYTGAPLATYESNGTAQDYYPFGEGVVGQVSPSGATDYYGFDGSGDVVSLSNPSGNVTNTYSYLPFGEPASGSTSTPFGFSGQFGITTDRVTGFTRNGVREYDPVTGRFISQDRALLNSPNAYEYAHNDPLDEFDLTGYDGAPDPLGVNDTVGSLLGQIFNLGIGGGVNDALNNNSSAGAQTNGVLTTAGNVLSGTQLLGAGGILAGGGQVPLEFSNPFTGLSGPLSNSNALAKGSNLGGALIGTAQAGVQLYNGDGWGALKTAGNTVISAAGPPGTGFVATAVENLVDVSSQHVFNIFWTLWYEPPSSMDVFGPAAGGNSPTRGSHDPNDMVGPTGYGAAGYIQGGAPLPYQVDFSNLAGADLPAAKVVVSEPLDPNVDLSRFSLGSFGFGRHVVTPPAGLRSYQTTIDDRAASGLDVRVTASLDSATRTVNWTFQSIDPATGLPPTNAAAGFLPPDQNPPEGEGFVSYQVAPVGSASTGTAIAANATVQFDANPVMTTSTVTNTIDDSAPSASVTALPATESGPFTVSWSGSDPGGSGVASYDVDVSTNGGPYLPLETDTTSTSTTFNGQPGDTYQFIAWATSNVGIAQPFPSAPQAQTTESGTPTTTTTTSTSAGPPPTTTGTTSSPPPAAQAKPKVSVTSGKVSVRGSVAPVTLACATARCSGAITLTAVKTVTVHKGHAVRHKRETVTYGASAYGVAAGGTVTVQVRLSRSALADLNAAPGKHLSVTARVTVTDGSTTRRTITLQISGKPAKPKHKHVALARAATRARLARDRPAHGRPARGRPGGAGAKELSPALEKLMRG